MSTASSDGLLLGLDIGGTKLAAVIGRESGEILHRVECATPHVGGDWRPALDALAGLAASVSDAVGIAPRDVAAVGVSCGGPLDSRRGVVLNPPNLPEWRDVPLKQALSDRLGAQVIALENDANATALAEHRWGAGRGAANLAYITFGTGIGAGLILNGALFRGKREFAGEIGHATIEPDGPLCLCGKRGCLEALASGGAIDRVARERFGNPAASAAFVCEQARLGNATALEIADRASRALGIGIANLLQTLDLERVILGSLAVKSGDIFLDPVRAYAAAYTWPSVMEGVEILPAGLGIRAQDLAALAVAADARRAS